MYYRQDVGLTIYPLVQEKEPGKDLGIANQAASHTFGTGLWLVSLVRVQAPKFLLFFLFLHVGWGHTRTRSCSDGVDGLEHHNRLSLTNRRPNHAKNHRNNLQLGSRIARFLTTDIKTVTTYQATELPSNREEADGYLIRK